MSSTTFLRKTVVLLVPVVVLVMVMVHSLLAEEGQPIVKPPETSSSEPQPVPAPAASEPPSPPAPEAQPAPAPTPAEAPADYLDIVGMVPLPDDLLERQIVIVFKEEIDLSKTGGKPFVLDPPVSGRTRFGPTYIAFQSDQFPKDRMVHFHLSEAITSRDGKPINPDQRHYTFTTFRFEPLRVYLVEDSPPRTAFGVVFPIPAAAEAVRRHLTVRTEAGIEVPFLLEPGADNKIHVVVLENHSDWPVAFIFSPGLTDQTGLFQTKREQTFRYPADPRLFVRSVHWGQFLPEEQEIYLAFSKPVHPEALKKHLAITDETTGQPVPFEILDQEAADRLTALVHLLTPRHIRLRVAVSPGLQGAGKTSLKEGFATVLERHPTPLAVQDYWWNYPREEGLVLYVRFTVPIATTELRKFISVTPELAGMRVESRDNQSFYVYGEWKSKQNYTMTIAAGLPSAEGIPLEKEIRLSLQTDEIRSYLGFGYEGRFYFPRRAGVPLSLQSRNVEKATVTLYRMFPSNLAVALNEMGDREEGYPIMKWGERLAEMELEVRLERDRMTDTPLDLERLFLGNTRGVFCIEARAHQHGVSAWKMVVWTDIGLLAHWQSDELVLFAHDLYSLAPLPSAQVTVYSRKNQALGRGATGEDGMARVGPFNPSLGAPGVVVVEQGSDYTFLELETRREDTAGLTYPAAPYDREGYDAFVYADRDLYRPGETVHLHWLVRTNYGDAVGEVPLLMRVTKPNGRTLIEQPTVLSALGAGGTDLETQREYPTGLYNATLLIPGKKVPIGSYSFHLEEFVPSRIKVTLTVPDAVLLAGQTHKVHLNAQHLFGAPATDRKCEVTAVLQRKGFTSQRWKGFRFDNDSDFTPDPVPCGEQRTDADGNAVFDFLYRAPAEVTFPLKAVVVGRAFELGGRSVVATAERMLFPSDVCLGVRAAPGPGGKGIEVFAAAIKPDESPADLATVKVTLERQVWNYYVRRYYSHHEPRWSQSFDPIETREVALRDGTGSARFDIREYGYYRVRVHSDTAPQYSTVSFYSYWGQCHLVDAARPSLIKITLDKPEYAIGEAATVKVESPFDGKGILVLQGETIQRMVAIDIQDGVGRALFELTREQVPNVWVEATVIHALKAGQAQVYPFSSFAMMNVPVRDPSRRLDVAISQAGAAALPEEIRPAMPVTLSIETRDADGAPAQAEVTLAAVDEGIHLVTGYESPDPYAWLCRPRRPDFRRAHYYDKVAYDFEKPAAGGGLDALLGKRAVSPDESWIKPVALWSGTVLTDANGAATVTFDIPEFTGQLRLVAVAAAESALGSKSANVFVRRPYMLQTSMPRFLLPGDTARCRATVFNHSDAPVRAEVRWSISGALRSGEGGKELAVPAHGEANLTAEFVAAGRTGQGGIRWEAIVRNEHGQELERLVEDAPIPVRAPAGYQSHHEVAVLAPGESRTFRNVQFLDDDRAEVSIIVGANPMLRLTKAFQYVIGYPYGCVEQTTSRLFPLYLLRRNAALFEAAIEETPESPEKLTVHDLGRLDMYLCAGINKLFAMQTYSGGLASWPGSDSPYRYGSIYALHFLTLAKHDRELELPEENFAALQRYVREISLDWTDDSWSARYARAYAIYVLALDGDIEAVRQIGRFDDVSLPRPARFLLAAALAMTTQDMNRVKLYLSATPYERYDVTEPDGTLISDIRNTAIELIALREMGGDPAEILERVNKLITFLEQRHYGTTQETAFVIAALAGYLSELEANIPEAAARITGPEGEAAIAGGQVYRGKWEGPGGAFTVANTGKTDLFVNAATRGVPETPQLEAVSKGVGVSRTLYTAKGDRLNLAESSVFHQADAYIIGVEISCSRDLKNLVVVDLFSAGFEVENPRLEADAIPGGKFDATVTPSYLDVRDDRLVLAFDALSRGTHRFYYVVRAVTPGLYQYPGVQAECMYDACAYGRSTPASIEVK